MLVHVQLKSKTDDGARLADFEMQVPDEVADIIGEEALEKCILFAASCFETEVWRHRKALKTPTRDDIKRVILTEKGVG